MRWAEPGDAEYVMGRPCYRTEHYVRAAERLAETYGATVVWGRERSASRRFTTEFESLKKN